MAGTRFHMPVAIFGGSLHVCWDVESRRGWGECCSRFRVGILLREGGGAAQVASTHFRMLVAILS